MQTTAAAANYFQQGMHAMARSLFVASSALPAPAVATGDHFLLGMDAMSNSLFCASRRKAEPEEDGFTLGMDAMSNSLFHRG